MPAGGARNAVDCALWELEAARAGMPVWRLAGIDAPKPVVTTFTIGADSPEKMAQDAIGYAQASSLKLKLTGELDLDIARVHAVRAARPEAWIGVDANQGFTIDNLDPLVDALVEARVSLLEQPLARGREADLTGYKCPIPIAADESCLTLDDVPGLLDRFQVVNIKLDKCGGLTEALLIVEQARRLGLGVMVGNMVGTSLAMAPAFIVGQLCDFVDLDGPLVLASDRDPGVLYSEGRIWCGEDVWGSGSGAAQ
jgi:L-alanine-DL-glutamate epimerase-like enolase superfamily enzyme